MSRMTYLWIQTSSISKKSLIAYDGKVYNKGEAFYDKMFKKLDSLIQHNSLMYRGESFSICSIPLRGWCVSGHFEEKDDLGRNVAFTFYTDSDNPKWIVEELFKQVRECKQSLGDDVPSILYECLNKVVRKRKLKRLIKIVLFGVFMLLMLALWMRK